jgi:hypothetical protein
MTMEKSQKEITELSWRIYDGRREGELASISDYVEYLGMLTGLTGEKLASHAITVRLLDEVDYENLETEESEKGGHFAPVVNDLGSVLDEAKDIIGNRGNSDYGSAERCMGNIAEQWNLYLSQTHGSKAVINEDDVCKMMVLLKIARDSHKPKRDNLVDIIGYTALSQEIRDSKDD